MLRGAVSTVAFCLLAVCFAQGSGYDGIDRLGACDSWTLSSAARESTVTTIPSLQGEYAIGGVAILSHSGYCILEDFPGSAIFGTMATIDEQVWAVWNLDALPPDADVMRVEIQHTLYPEPWNDPGVRVLYKRLDCSVNPSTLPCLDVWSGLTMGEVYADVEMGTVAGTRRCELGGGATQHLEERLLLGEIFVLGISTDMQPEQQAAAMLPGWDAGGIELIVTWRDPSSVEPQSWSAIKALFRPRRGGV